MGLLGWFRRKSAPPAHAASPAAESGQPPAAPPEEGPALSGHQEELRSVVLERYEFDYLAMFDLVPPVEDYCQDLLPDGTATEAGDAADSLMERALSDAIVKLAEPDVPREIAGQRLAAVIDVCKAAADWEEMPSTAAVARRYLERG